MLTPNKDQVGPSDPAQEFPPFGTTAKESVTDDAQFTGKNEDLKQEVASQSQEISSLKKSTQQDVGFEQSVQRLGQATRRGEERNFRKSGLILNRERCFERTNYAIAKGKCQTT